MRLRALPPPLAAAPPPASHILISVGCTTTIDARQQRQPTAAGATAAVAPPPAPVAAVPVAAGGGRERGREEREGGGSGGAYYRLKCGYAAPSSNRCTHRHALADNTYQTGGSSSAPDVCPCRPPPLLHTTHLLVLSPLPTLLHASRFSLLSPCAFFPRGRKRFRFLHTMPRGLRIAARHRALLLRGFEGVSATRHWIVRVLQLYRDLSAAFVTSIRWRST